MYHFFVEPHQIGAEEIRIEGADVNHIRNVLRMKPGEEILISSREGGDYFCRVEELEPEYVSAKILEEWENKELPARIHLFQGLPKGDKMELIIQKAVELGVTAVVLAALMGFSRLYVGVHFPSDVLAGVLVGLFCGWLACLLWQRFAAWRGLEA